MLVTSYEQNKVADILRKEKPRKVCLIFWHGLGDFVLFIKCYEKLKKLFPNIVINIALQKGVGQEYLIPDAILIENANKSIDSYDYTFQIHFPMAEFTNGLWTKAEWCCIQELGIEPINELPHLSDYKFNKANKQVSIHFQATALPKSCNVPYEIAKKIWSEVKEADYIPRETLFKHRYYNPVNEKYDFIDNHCRNEKPSIESLIKVLKISQASLCVASGNLPMSLAIMPERTLYFKKAYSIKCYMKKDIQEIDINNYKDGQVKEWLKNMQ